MHGANEFLTALTIVLGVAGLTTVLFHRLHQPVVLGYILAGLIIGPHVPIPLIADPSIVLTLSELGVILLMFGLGLEFSFGKLIRAAPTAGVTALIQCSVMVLLGFFTGRLLGWTMMESIFAGAVIAISSTTIIAKAFDEQGIQGRLRELVVAILIVEDLIAVVLMAVLTGIGTGSGLSANELGLTLARLGAFLVGLVVVGLLVVPRVMRYVVKVGRAETTIIASIALCFAISLLAHELGYSVALGAFVAGVLVAESGASRQIEPLVHPIRDLFGAVFFVSVGLQFDPSTIAEHWVAVIVMTLVVILGKLGSVALGAFLTGNGTRTSIAAGMSLAQIGEFSFIIAGLGVTLGVVGNYLYPVAVAVSAITTLTTPWLIRASGPVGNLVDRTLPKPLQTFVGFYESWIDRLRSARGGPRSVTRRLVRTVLLDVIVVAIIVITAALTFDRMVAKFMAHIYPSFAVARFVIVVTSSLLALPFCIGIMRSTGRLAAVLAVTAVPHPHGQVDLGEAPRRMLASTLQLAGVLIAGLPLVALTQPFLPGVTAVAVLLVAVVVLGLAFWRTARNLHGHVRASSQLIVEALAAQSASSRPGFVGPDPYATAVSLLPGLGDWQRVEVPTEAHAVGRSIADLEVRGATGATVLAVTRDGAAVPDIHEPLRAGDVLAITGSDDAIAAASDLLRKS